MIPDQTYSVIYMVVEPISYRTYAVERVYSVFIIHRKGTFEGASPSKNGFPLLPMGEGG